MNLCRFTLWAPIQIGPVETTFAWNDLITIVVYTIIVYKFIKTL